MLSVCHWYPRRNPHECAVAKDDAMRIAAKRRASQPARMRCGKGSFAIPTVSEPAVATRTNALWQRRFDRKLFLELLVATRTNALWQRKDVTFNNIADFVATRTNALWQRSNICAIFALAAVATRTNALWQRTALRKLQWRVLKSQPARMRCGKGNKPLE